MTWTCFFFLYHSAIKKKVIFIIATCWKICCLIWQKLNRTSVPEDDIPRFYSNISGFCALKCYFNERISLFSLNELLCWKIYNLAKSVCPKGHVVFYDFRPEAYFLSLLKYWQYFGYRDSDAAFFPPLLQVRRKIKLLWWSAGYMFSNVLLKNAECCFLKDFQNHSALKLPGVSFPLKWKE